MSGPHPQTLQSLVWAWAWQAVLSERPVSGEGLPLAAAGREGVSEEDRKRRLGCLKGQEAAGPGRGSLLL